MHLIQYLFIKVNSFHHKGQKLLCYKNKEAVFLEAVKADPRPHSKERPRVSLWTWKGVLHTSIPMEGITKQTNKFRRNVKWNKINKKYPT